MNCTRKKYFCGTSWIWRGNLLWEWCSSYENEVYKKKYPRELTISMSQLNYTSINCKLYYKRFTNNKITLIAAVIISDVIFRNGDLTHYIRIKARMHFSIQKTIHLANAKQIVAYAHCCETSWKRSPSVKKQSTALNSIHTGMRSRSYSTGCWEREWSSAVSSN